MSNNIRLLENKFMKAVADAGDSAELEAIRVAALGKNGEITALLKTLGDMSPEERKTQGAAINKLKDQVSNLIDVRKKAFMGEALDARLASETVDVTLPVRDAPAETGRIH